MSGAFFKLMYQIKAISFFGDWWCSESKSQKVMVLTRRMRLGCLPHTYQSFLQIYTCRLEIFIISAGLGPDVNGRHSICPDVAKVDMKMEDLHRMHFASKIHKILERTVAKPGHSGHKK